MLLDVLIFIIIFESQCIILRTCYGFGLYTPFGDVDQVALSIGMFINEVHIYLLC